MTTVPFGSTKAGCARNSLRASCASRSTSCREAGGRGHSDGRPVRPGARPCARHRAIVCEMAPSPSASIRPNIRSMLLVRRAARISSTRARAEGAVAVAVSRFERRSTPASARVIACASNSARVTSPSASASARVKRPSRAACISSSVTAPLPSRSISENSISGPIPRPLAFALRYRGAQESQRDHRGQNACLEHRHEHISCCLLCLPCFTQRRRGSVASIFRICFRGARRDVSGRRPRGGASTHP